MVELFQFQLKSVSNRSFGQERWHCGCHSYEEEGEESAAERRTLL